MPRFKKTSVSTLPPLSEDIVRSNFLVFQEEYEAAQVCTYWEVPKNDRILKAEEVVAPYVFGFLSYVNERLGGRKTGLYYLDQAVKVYDLLEQEGGAKIGEEYIRFSYLESNPPLRELGYIYVKHQDQWTVEDLSVLRDYKIFNPCKWEEIIKEEFEKEQAGIVALMRCFQDKLAQATKNFEDFLCLKKKFGF